MHMCQWLQNQPLIICLTWGKCSCELLNVNLASCIYTKVLFFKSLFVMRKTWKFINETISNLSFHSYRHYSGEYSGREHNLAPKSVSKQNLGANRMYDPIDNRRRDAHVPQKPTFGNTKQGTLEWDCRLIFANATNKLHLWSCRRTEFSSNNFFSMNACFFLFELQQLLLFFFFISTGKKNFKISEIKMKKNNYSISYNFIQNYRR